MNNRIFYRLLALALIAFWGGLIWLSFRLATPERTINCGIAEISPDFATEMRQACRERMRHKL